MRFPSQLRWFWKLFIPVVLVAVVADLVLGRQAAANVVGFAAALAGAVAGIIRLVGEADESETSAKPTLSPRRRQQLVLAAAFTIGGSAALGTTALTNHLFPSTPVVRVRAPAYIDKVDRVEVRWKRLPAAHEIWLLVHRLGERTYYPQTFHISPQFDGSTQCVVQVGRSDESGEVFEIIPVLAMSEAGKELERGQLDGADGLPPHLITYPPAITRRK